MSRRVTLAGAIGDAPFISALKAPPRPVALMTHEEKIETAITRSYDQGLISKEVIAQLPSMRQFVTSIIVVAGVLAALGVTAGMVASTGVGAILEGIAAAIVLTLSAIGIITSARLIIAGIKTLMRFYQATKAAQTYPELDTAGKDFATGITEVGIGTILMILSVMGARQGIKMGRGAAGKWNARNVPPPPETPPQPKKPDPPEPVKGTVDESAKPFSPKEKAIADTLAGEGKYVQAVPESKVPGVRSPDALVDRKPTEFKSLDPAATSGTVDLEKSTLTDEERDQVIRRIAVYGACQLSDMGDLTLCHDVVECLCKLRRPLRHAVQDSCSRDSTRVCRLNRLSSRMIRRTRCGWPANPRPCSSAVMRGRP